MVMCTTLAGRLTILTMPLIMAQTMALTTRLAIRHPVVSIGTT